MTAPALRDRTCHLFVQQSQVSMARKRYWVIPEWDVRHNGQVLSHHYLKSTAVEAGTKVAKANQPSQLTVLKLDGTIEYEHTYGRFCQCNQDGHLSYRYTAGLARSSDGPF